MGAVTIDELQIRISGSSTNAYASVDALVGALEKLQHIRIDGGIAQSINNIGKAASKATSKVSKMADAFAKGAKNAVDISRSFTWEYTPNWTPSGRQHFETPWWQIAQNKGTDVVPYQYDYTDSMGTIDAEFRDVTGMGEVNMRDFLGLETPLLTMAHDTVTGFNDIESAAQRATEATMELWRHNAETQEGLSAIERSQAMKDAFSAFSSADWSQYNPSYAFFNSIENGFDHLKQKASEAAKSLGTFFKSIQRIAMYRAIRSALKFITSGLKEGIENLAQYSKAIGETDSWAANTVMSDYATKLLQVKNAVASAVMPALAALQPVLMSIANAFIYATNAINMFFSAIGGSSTYTQAEAAAVDYAATLDKSASGAKQATKALTAGIDELNVISESSGGGGSSSANGMPDFKDMFSEEIIPQWLIDNLETIKNLVIAIGLGFLAWKVASAFTESLGKIAGIALAVAGAFLLVKGAIEGWTEGVNWTNLAEMVGGTALLAGGLALAFGTVGAAIGLLVGGVAMLVVGIKDWITTGELSTETMWLLVAGIMAVGLGLTLLIGWIPIVVAAVLALALIIYKYWDEIKAFCINLWTSVSEFFVEVWENIKTGVENAWNAIGDFFTETIPTIIGNIVNWFLELPSKIAYALGFVLGSLFAWSQNVANWIITEVPKLITKIVDFFKELPSKIKTAIDKVKETIVQWVTDAIGWVKENVPKVINSIIDWFSKVPEALVNIGKNMIKALWNGILSMGDWLWNKVVGFLGDLGEFASEIFGSFGKGIEEGYESVPKYASGGIVGSGQMFIARENGAELVGNIGGSTAVMNNDQIVSAVSMGVYDAVVSAMSQSGNGAQSIQVFLNGKQIEASTRETKQRRGASIANGGIYNFA